MDREQERHKWRERQARQREREKQVLAHAIENAGPPPTRDELLRLLGIRARQGHVRRFLRTCMPAASSIAMTCCVR
jgi:hypothetical protein